MTPKIYTNVLYVVVLRIGFVVLVTRPTILYSWTGLLLTRFSAGLKAPYAPGRKVSRVYDASVVRDSSNLVADRFEAKFYYAIVVADLVAYLQRADISPITHYLACSQRASKSATGLRPASGLSATRIA